MACGMVIREGFAMLMYKFSDFQLLFKNISWQSEEFSGLKKMNKELGFHGMLKQRQTSLL